MVTYYSCNTLPTDPSSQTHEAETLKFLLTCSASGVIVLFEVLHSNDFSVDLSAFAWAFLSSSVRVEENASQLELRSARTKGPNS